MKLIGLLGILFLFAHVKSYASHAAGGEIYYEWKSANTYDIYVRMFRDCNSTATLPLTVDLGIYDKVTNVRIYDLDLTRDQVNTALDLGDDCYTPPGLCIDEIVYKISNQFIMNNANGYYLQTEIYARNANVTNLTDPDDYTLVYFAEMPNPAMGENSSPDFGSYPLDSYFCLNSSKSIIFPVVDNDGDSLVFSFVDPLEKSNGNGTTAGTGGYPYYPSVPWAAPYSLTNICGGTVPMTIDGQTGEIIAQPSNVGIFAFVVRIEEYRSGVKIGEVRRDVQYSSLSCAVDAPPVINLSDTVTVYYGDEICVDITVADTDGSDTIYVSPTSVDFDLVGNFVTPTAVGTDFVYTNFNNTGVNGTMSHFADIGTAYESVGEILLRYCWSPDCGDVDSTYHINLLAYSLGCSGSDTTEKEITFEVDFKPTPIELNLPSEIEVTYNEEICFELLTNDMTSSGFQMGLKPLGDILSYDEAFVAPNQNSLGHYYTNFQGLDTLYIDNYSYSGGEVRGTDTVAMRFCLTPGCDEVVLTTYDLEFKSTIYGDCNEVSETKVMTVNVDPPVGVVAPVPNVFTPNGDGDNDYFELSGTNDPCYDVMAIEIFNRWGKKVFESEDSMFSWNGTNKNDGGECAAGTYFVLIKGTYGSTYEPGTGTRIPNPIDQQYTIQLLR